MRTPITHISFRALIPLLLFFTLVINAPGLSAAPGGSTYPVQVSPMLIPPYSLYLSDYFSGTTERLSLTLTNRDLQQPQVRVKLRLTIACASGLTLTTYPQAVFDPIVLDAGVPTRLTMQELAPYFLPARLLTQGYMQGGKLTEGNVEFGFEVLEYNTGKVLSQKNIAFGNIISPKPPKLNLPINNDIVTVNEPQQLTFQWSPQYFSTGNVEYEFVIKELMDKTASPQEAFLYSREVYRTTTTASAINYTMGEPTLEGNKRYAWCVRAVMHEGVETVNRFENDGYSPVSVFDMRYDCRPPTDVQATTERGTIMLRWLPQPHHLKYVVSYRRTDFDANTWYTKTTTSTFINLSDIAPGQNYTYRVGAYCDDNTPVYSAPGTISVPAEDTEFLANCGKDPQIKITNRKPKGQLNVNDIIMAGDFPVTITSVSGGNGTFTGEGWVRIPYLFANFGVRFSGIGVSEENRLISGQVETKYDKTESGVSNLDALDQGGTDGNIKSGITKANKTVEFALPEKFTVQYSEELATLTFKNETGTAIGNVDIPKNPAGKPILPLTVEDKNGNVYEVHENPEKSTTNPQPYVAVKLGKQEGEIPFGSMDLNVQDEAKATVTFANDASSLYALDSWQNYYSSVGIISGGNGDPNSNFDGCKYEKIGANYWVKWKYIPPGKTDKVTAELLINDKAKIDPAKVVFKTKAGKVFESSYNASTRKFTITLLGGEDKDGQELYAMHPATESGKYWNLGKLDMMSYSPVERKMVLVKTSANDNTDAATVQTELNRIYNPVGISWSVSSEQFIYNTDNIFEGKSGVISTYLPNMRTLNAAFMAAKADKLETKTAYLFLVNQTAGGDRDKQGFMPRGMQFGYINTSTANVSSVIAHELGHGAFKLYHTFNSGYGSTAVGTQGKTENLMDYKGGINFAKWQWDQMYDPAIINGVFDGDKEAESNAVWQENLKKLQATLLQIGENGCAFVRKQTSVSTNKEQNTSVTTTSIDYLVGKYKNTQLAFDTGLGNETTTEFSKGIRLLLESDNKNWILYVVNGSVEACEAKEDYSSFGSLSTAKSDPIFLNKCKTDLLNCKVDENTYIKNILSQLQSNARSNQTIEFSYNNKSYTLKDNNIQQIELSYDDINGGNWTDINVDARFRYEVNSNGIIQLKAFGYRNNLAVAKGKSANLKEISTHILQQTNKYLQENKVIDFAQIAPDVNTDLFADGKKIEIGNNSSFFKIISEGVGVVTTLLKTAEIEKPIYLESTENNTTIHAPGIVTGSTEVIAQKVTGLTSLATGIYDLVTDAETRSNVYNGLVQVKDAIGNDPTAFVPIMVNVISSVATGNSIPEWQEVNNSQTDAGRRSHLGTRGVGNTIITAFAATAFIKELPEIAEKVSEKIKSIKNILRFTSEQIDEYVTFATKNQAANKVMLGKYDNLESTSYIKRAGNEYTCFDMGTEKWKEAEAFVNKNTDEMWKINKEFIDRQKALGKDFYFSHEPWSAQSHEYLSKEAEYLIDLGAKDFKQIDKNTWKAIW